MRIYTYATFRGKEPCNHFIFVIFVQSSLFELMSGIKNLDILSMTPLDAMNALFSLQKKVKNK